MEVEGVHFGAGIDEPPNQDQADEAQVAAEEDDGDLRILGILDNVTAEDEDDPDKFTSILIMSDKNDDNYEYLKEAIIDAYGAANEAEEKAVSEPRPGEAPNAVATKSRLEISVGPAGSVWRKNVGRRMENNGDELITWKERHRRFEGVRSLMKSFHPHFSTTTFLNENEVKALAELLGLVTHSPGNWKVNTVRALRFRTWDDFENGVENGAEITPEEIDEAEDEWSEGLNYVYRGYTHRLVHYLKWEGTFGNAHTQLLLNLDTQGFVWMNNGKDCLVVRNDCLSNLGGFTKKDVPQLSTMMEWNQFEISDRYYELCAEAKRNNSEWNMTFRQLKEMEEQEESEEMQELIDSL